MSEIFRDPTKWQCSYLNSLKDILGPKHELQPLSLLVDRSRSIDFMRRPEPPTSRLDWVIRQSLFELVVQQPTTFAGRVLVWKTNKHVHGSYGPISGSISCKLV
jgi:hypothetical protein